MVKKIFFVLYCGKFVLSLRRVKNVQMTMIDFIGEYDCKVDAKGRILLPIQFRKELGEVEAFCFVIKKHIFAHCLELYTKAAWEEQIGLIKDVIDPFNEEDLQAQRDFRRGSTIIECDPAGRVLLPARLLKQAEIGTDALLLGSEGRIEIWQPDLYFNSGGSDKERKERFKNTMAKRKAKKNDE